MPNDRFPTATIPAPRRADLALDATELSLRALYDQLRAAHWTVLRIALSVFLLGLAFTLLWPASYQADGILQIEDDARSSPLAQIAQIAQLPAAVIGGTGGAATEIEMLKSRAVIDPVIARQHLDIAAVPRHFPLIGAFVSRVLGGDSAQPAWAPFGLRRWAWGGERIVVEQLEVPFAQLNAELTLVVAEGSGYVLRDSWGQELLRGSVGTSAVGEGGRYRMRIRELRARPGTHFSVTRYAHDDAVDNVLAVLSVAELASGSGTVQVAYTAATREAAQAFVADLQASYLERNAGRRADSARRSLAFLQDQLPPLKTRLALAQKRLSEYQQAHGSSNIANETGQLVSQSTNLETRRVTLVTELDKVRQIYAADHPAVRSLQQQMASVEREQAALRARNRELPPTQQDILSLTHDVEAYTALYQGMLESIQSYEIAKAGTVSNVQVIDPPVLPHKPHFPKPLVTLPLSLILGLVAGVGWVFAQRGMLRGVDDPAAVRDAGLNLLAAIPYAGGQGALDRLLEPAPRGWRALRRRLALVPRLRREEKPDVRNGVLLAVTRPEDPAIDALRALRERLALESAPNNLLMLAGPAGGAGASFVAANLAALLALSGRRVAIVDADLREGRIHRLFGATGDEAGVGDFVIADLPLESLLRPTRIKGLSYVSRGTRRAGAAEILLHARFAGMIRSLSQNFDVVVVDTSPAANDMGAATVGRLAGTSLLVLGAARHRAEEIDALVDRFASMGVALRGAVFNQVGREPGSFGHVARPWFG